jgi:hypothetical protein
VTARLRLHQLMAWVEFFHLWVVAADWRVPDWVRKSFGVWRSWIQLIQVQLLKGGDVVRVESDLLTASRHVALREETNQVLVCTRVLSSIW